jgi:hypothetical protein
LNRGKWKGKSGAEGDRTLNLSIANAALSQLSYGPGKLNSTPAWNGVNPRNRERVNGLPDAENASFSLVSVPVQCLRTYVERHVEEPGHVAI